MDEVRKWVELVFSDMTEADKEKKTQEYHAALNKTNSDLASFRPDPRAAHTSDPRKANPL